MSNFSIHTERRHVDGVSKKVILQHRRQMKDQKVLILLLKILTALSF